MSRERTWELQLILDFVSLRGLHIVSKNEACNTWGLMTMFPRKYNSGPPSLRCQYIKMTREEDESWKGSERFLKDEEGAAAVEYGLLIAGIAAGIISVVYSIGAKIKAAFETVNTNLAVRARPGRNGPIRAVSPWEKLNERQRESELHDGLCPSLFPFCWLPP